MKYLSILCVTGWFCFAVMAFNNYSIQSALHHPIKPIADDAAIRAAYAFQMTPECCQVQPTAIEAESIVKPAAKVQQNFRHVCSCGRTLDCTCEASQCDCEACKADTIKKCKCSAPCACGCENGKECVCITLRPAQSVLQFSAPPRLTAGACVGGR